MVSGKQRRRGDNVIKESFLEICGSAMQNSSSRSDKSVPVRGRHAKQYATRSRLESLQGNVT
jgi:hypothetical protein